MFNISRRSAAALATVLAKGTRSITRPTRVLQNRINPFAVVDSDILAGMICSSMPISPDLSLEEQALFDKARAEGEAHYQEQRHGRLPPGTYRILEQGSFAGWRLELEIDGKEIELNAHPETRAGAYAAFRNRALAERLARAEIARRHGEEAAQGATFRAVWGGTM
jgi:hypothetical protein